MNVQKAALVGREGEPLSVKSAIKKLATQNARVIKSRKKSKNVTLTNALSGELARGWIARKRVVVEHNLGKQKSFF